MMAVGYLFLGGAGAGSCVLLAALGLLAPADRVAARCAADRRKPFLAMCAPVEYRLLMGPPFAAACACLAAGSGMLVFDLGVPLRVALLFVSPAPTLQTVGAFALAALTAVSFLLALAWSSPVPRWSLRLVNLMHAAALVAGAVAVAYTGFLLAGMPAVPFWSSGWIPVLFVASSLSCGCALVLASSCLTGSFGEFSAVMRRVMRADLAFIAVEVVAVAAVLAAALSHPHGVAASGVEALLLGPQAMLFIVGFGFLGVVAPALLEAGSLSFGRHAPSAVLAASAAVLAGGFVLRHCIVAVGAHPEVWTVVL